RVHGAHARARQGRLGRAPFAVVRDQIRYPRIDPELREQRGELAAVMRLVVEEVSERRTERMRELLSGVRRVGEVFEQPLGREGRRVLLDRGVGVGALAPQLVEVRVELLIERTEGPRGS